MKKGFTLIELVMIIVILGILAVVAIPRYVGLQTEARQSAEAGVVGGVRAGVHTYYANQCATGSCSWPTQLDSAAAPSNASVSNPFFDNVLSQGGVTSDWGKNANGTYTGPTGAVYAYNNSDGSFLAQP